MSRIIVLALTTALLAVPFVVTTTAAAAPKCGGLTATIVGNDKANVLVGTFRRDVIVAKGGNDQIMGKGGNDVICAGSGDDLVDGGKGNDIILGQAGDDHLHGDAQWDKLKGGPGKDACYVGANGGKTIDCEEANFRTTVRGPRTAKDGKEFAFAVKVKNVGAKAAAFDLVIFQGIHFVVCDTNNSGTESLGLLRPGDYVWRGYSQTCAIADDDPHVHLTATAETTAPEDNPKNNEATATAEIVPAP